MLDGNTSFLSINVLTEISRTPDGLSLILCSSDGYCSFIRFEEGELGSLSGNTICTSAFSSPEKGPKATTVADHEMDARVSSCNSNKFDKEPLRPHEVENSIAVSASTTIDTIVPSSKKKRIIQPILISDD